MAIRAPDGANKMFKQEINRKRNFPTNRRFVPKMKKALRAM